MLLFFPYFVGLRHFYCNELSQTSYAPHKTGVLAFVHIQNFFNKDHMFIRWDLPFFMLQKLHVPFVRALIFSYSIPRTILKLCINTVKFKLFCVLLFRSNQRESIPKYSNNHDAIGIKLPPWLVRIAQE